MLTSTGAPRAPAILVHRPAKNSLTPRALRATGAPAPRDPDSRLAPPRHTSPAGRDHRDMRRDRSSWLLAALLPLLGCGREVGAVLVSSVEISPESPVPSALPAPVAEGASTTGVAADPFERREPILALGRAFS